MANVRAYTSSLVARNQITTFQEAGITAIGTIKARMTRFPFSTIL